MQSKIFDIAITGKYLSLLIPEHIVLPFLEENHKRVKAKASYEGKKLQFYGAFQKRNGNYYMMFSKWYQKELGIFPNDYFQLQFFEDDSKYGVEMPEELEAVFSSDYNAFHIFESFTAGKKRGIIYSILNYRVSQTRIDKSILVCENLKKGVRDNRELFKSF